MNLDYRNKLLLLAPAISLLSWLGTPSVAQPPDGFRPPSPLIDALDSNEDGEISASELKNAARALRSLDRNRDGQLSYDEIGGGGHPQFGGFGPPGGGRGGPPKDQKILKDFDADKNGRLDANERKAALNMLRDLGTGGSRRGRRRGPQRDGPAEKGPLVSVSEVESFPEATLYDPSIVRTVFLNFDFEEWESEMAALKRTDVDVPATLIVDGKEYPNVGVHFRGMSSFDHVPATYKRSLNVSMDFVDGNQRLYGYKTLNLLNCNGDASMMSSVLYSHIAARHLPVAKANLIKVVINGEYWGIYSNVQQFNKQFLDEHFDSSKGARWKVSGNPNADGGLRYLGDEIAPYRERFEIKSKDKEESWRALIELCRVLNETSEDRLVESLEPILNIDGLLWFLALDVALVNSDGYWTRASDYNIFRDRDGRFHIIPHDMNEAFKDGRGRGGSPLGRRGPGGPPPGGRGQFGGGRGGFPGRGPEQGGRGGPGGGGHGDATLDPLVGLDSDRMPLRSRLLRIPELRTRYLQNVRAIAGQLDWKRAGGLVAETRKLIADDVRRDTKKLTTWDDFEIAMNDKPLEGAASLRNFFDKRRAFLLRYPAIQSLPETDEAREKADEVSLLKGAPVVINELMASNKKSVKDSQGRFHDWIELHNRSDQKVDLSTLFLSDAARSLKKWQFPKGTTIEPGQHLIVWADGNDLQSDGLHTNFKLSKDGEAVLLCREFEGELQVWDQVRFGPQQVDVSIGRTGEAGLVRLSKPTPGRPNQ